MRPALPWLCSLTLLFATVVHGAPDAWERVGPLSGAVSFAAIHPTNDNIIYFTTSAGLQSTLDAGETWAPVPVTSRQVLFDPLNPDVIYAYTHSNGISRSSDGGASWSSIASFYAASLAIDPSNPNRLYAGTVAPTGVYVSNDGGASWSLSTFGPWGGLVASLAVDAGNGSVAYAGTIGDFDHPGSGLFKTIDGGTSWTHVSIGPYDSEIGCVAVDPSNSNVVYVGTTFGGWPIQGLLKSSDAGATWSSSSAGLPDYVAVDDIALDPTRSGMLYVVAGRLLYRSADAGGQWVEVDTRAYAGTSGIDLFRSNPDVLCIAAGYGVATSHDLGGHFHQFGTQPADVAALAVDRTNSDVLYCTGSGLFKSVDRGVHWQATRAVGYGMAIAQDPANPQTIYAGAYTDEEVAKSTDTGETWAVSLVNRAINDLEIAPSNSSVVYAGGAGILKTVNGGISWVTLTTSYGQAVAIDVLPTDDNVVYVGGMEALVKSVDGGATWSRIENGLNRPASGYVLEVTIDPMHPETVYCGTSKQGIFKSLDGGANWSHVTSPMNDVRAIAIDPSDTEIVYASIWAGALYVTVDGGDHWQQLGTALVGGKDLVIDTGDRDVLYSTAGIFFPEVGVWRYERTSQCAVPVISWYGPSLVDVSACAQGCDVLFTIDTADDFASVAVVALQRKFGAAWIEEDRILAPLSTPAWQLQHTFGSTDAPGQYVFRAVTRGVDGSRAVSDEVVVSLEKAVPTFFSSVACSYEKGIAVIRWTAEETPGLAGFNVYRRALPQVASRRLNALPVSAAGDYSYTDHEVVPGGEYSYQVEAVDENGETWLSQSVVLSVPTSVLELLQNQPNPFNPTTSISFRIPLAAHARLTIHDVNGQLVATILNRVVTAGHTAVTWNGRNSSGESVSSGVYFYRLDTSGRVLTRRMVLLK